jgi:hypothetical protein
MSALSDYAENLLLDTLFADPVYLALYTSAPTDAGGGTEVSGGSYARPVVNMEAASGGSTNPDADTPFPQATANWGTITHIGIKDAATAGNLLMWAPLVDSEEEPTSKVIEAGDTLIIDAADLDISLA